MGKEYNMTDTPAKLNYSGKDYNSIKQELIAKIPAITSKWTDHNEADLGITLLELFVGIADKLAFYLDRTAGECFLPTARVRRSVSNICAALDYQLSPPIGASITETATLSTSYPFDITIPVGFKISTSGTSNKITYSTFEPVIIPAGTTVKEFVMCEGIRNEATYTSTGIAYQVLTIPAEIQKAPNTDTFVQLYVNDVLWSEEYNTLLGLTNTYLIDISGDDTVISFGDGTNGNIPPIGATIEVVYWTGNGVSGRVGANTLTQIESPLVVGSFVTPITISMAVTNDESSIGGSDKESIEHAKYWAPKMLKMGDRLVTLDDYETYASSFSESGIGTVELAKAYWKSSDIYSCELDLYVLSKDIDGNYVACSTELKTALSEAIDERRCVAQSVNILDGTVSPIIIDLDVYIGSNLNSSVVSANVITALSDYIGTLKFQSALYTSKIIDLVMGVDGVYHVIINLPTSDVIVGQNEVVSLSDVLVNIVTS